MTSPDGIQVTFRGGSALDLSQEMTVLSNELTINANFCTACGHPRRFDDRFCTQCGSQFLELESGGTQSLVATAGNSTAVSEPLRPLATDATPSQAIISIAPSLVPILNNRWIVIGLLAAVGPIGLPALWFSPRFKPWVKLTISIIYFLLTAFLPLALAWYWLDFALRPLVDVF